MSHITHCVDVRVMSHIFMSRVSHMAESYREGSVYTTRTATPTTKTTALKRGAVPSWQVLVAGASTRGMWLIYMRDVTHSHTSAVLSWQAHVAGASTCVTWLIYMRDVTHSHTSAVPSWQAHVAGASTCVTWLIYMRDMTHSHKCCAVLASPCCRCIHMCDVTHPYAIWLIRMWHDSFIRVTWLIHTQVWCFVDKPIL